MNVTLKVSSCPDLPLKDILFLAGIPFLIFFLALPRIVFGHSIFRVQIRVELLHRIIRAIQIWVHAHRVDRETIIYLHLNSLQILNSEKCQDHLIHQNLSIPVDQRIQEAIKLQVLNRLMILIKIRSVW